MLYTGVTNNIAKRMIQHAIGSDASFTGRYRVLNLVFWEEFEDVRSAIEREKQIKGGSRLKKIKLIIGSNPHWKDLRNELV